MTIAHSEFNWVHTASQAARPRARAELYKLTPPSVACFRTTDWLKSPTLGADTKDQISSFMIRCTLADGEADPGKVRNLEKFFKAFGLDPSTLYAKLHAGGQPACNPQQMVDGDQHQSSTSQIFDNAKVAALKANSAKILRCSAKSSIKHPKIPNQYTPNPLLEFQSLPSCGL